MTMQEEVELKPDPLKEIWFRYSNSYGFDDVRIHIEEYEVVKHTPKGVWINELPWWPEKNKLKFVLNGPGKRFCYPTREAALDSFVHRKRRQIIHLENQLKTAERALEISTLMVKDGVLERPDYVCTSKLDPFDF